MKYGLIGHPLGHSFSRRFFNEEFFPSRGIDAEYVNYDIPDISLLSEVLKDNPDLCGLNCTIPYKQAVMPMLDSISDEAREIGAVNVVSIRRDSDGKPRLRGYNSDVIGFVDSIRPLLREHHRKALVLGTGGASRAVCHGLGKLGIEYLLVSRTPRPGQITYDDVTESLIREYEVIVNCSPVGMYPNVDAAPRLPYHAMSADNLLYDLIYNPLTTEFMRRGHEHGAVTRNGLEMLHLQALASWDFWNETK